MSEPSVPKSAVAEAGKTTAFKVPPKLVPIIVVPGIMGTRLSENVYDPAVPARVIGQELVWNPLGMPLATLPTAPNLPPIPIPPIVAPIPGIGPAAALGHIAATIYHIAGSYKSPGYISFGANRLKLDKHTLFPDTFNCGTSSEGHNITNYSHVVTEFYGKLCCSLRDELAKLLAARNLVPQVYCAGYDWRQSNHRSALALQTVVNQAIKETHSNQVIIVAHSQGGIVARAFCNPKGGYSGQGRVKALILLGSPTLGAPKAYSMLKSGIADLALQYAVLKSLTNEGVRDFARSMPSIYQLCPPTLFGRWQPHWITFDRSKTGYPSPYDTRITPPASAQFDDCSIHQLDLYNDMYTGITSEKGRRIADYAAHAREAARFHDSLLDSSGKTYMHPDTYVIYSSKKSTTMGGQLITESITHNYIKVGLLESSAHSGDGTVPATSANPPDTTHPIKEAIDLEAVEHGELSNNDAALAWVNLFISTKIC